MFILRLRGCAKLIIELHYVYKAKEREMKNRKCLIEGWNEEGIILNEELFMGECGFVVEWENGVIWCPKNNVKIIS